MPQTIYGGQVGSETLRAGKALTINVDAGSGGVLEQWRDGRVIASSAITATTTVGPFIDDTVLRLSANAGATLRTSDQAAQTAQRSSDAKQAAVDAVVSDAGYVDSYATDVWQEITATGLAIPLPVTVKAIKLIGGTSPTLALRDALVDTYSASSASTDVAFDSSVTPVQLGYEYPLNKLFRLGVHATVGGTSPRWAIKI